MAPRPVSNPPNPWLTGHVEWLGPPPAARLEVFEDPSREILSRNDSPDLGFTWSVNPYRGCQHACAYCYARPYHEYLGYGAGSDFDTKVVVKPRAPELLRRAFARPSWRARRWPSPAAPTPGSRWRPPTGSPGAAWRSAWSTGTRSAW